MAGVDGDGDAGDVRGEVGVEVEGGVGDGLGVRMAPGLIALQRIPYGASSSAMFFIRPMTPCLAAT